jgi:hypothetical protein
MSCSRLVLLPLPFVVLLAATPSNALAQGSLSLTAGQRVRITAPDLGLKRQRAVLDGHQGDMLLVTMDSTTSIPVGAVTRLEVHRGTRWHPWRGAGIGFGVGAIAGGVATCASCVNQYDCDPAGLTLPSGASTGGCVSHPTTAPQRGRTPPKPGQSRSAASRRSRSLPGARLALRVRTLVGVAERDPTEAAGVLRTVNRMWRNTHDSMERLRLVPDQPS